MIRQALAITFVAVTLGAPAFAAALTDEQKAEVKALIEQTIHDKPGILVEALQNYERDKDRIMTENAEKKIEEQIGMLTDSRLPSVGSSNPDLTVVEFYDYNCGYCKRALEDIEKIVAEDKKVRFVFHELPVLGPSSITAAQWSRAAHRQGKFFEFHKALMHDRSAKDEEALSKLAVEAGLDVEKMKKDIQDPALRQEIETGVNFAMEANIMGTPGFIVGKTLYRGYLGPEGFKQAIAEARNPNADTDKKAE